MHGWDSEKEDSGIDSDSRRGDPPYDWLWRPERNLLQLSDSSETDDGNLMNPVKHGRYPFRSFQNFQVAQDNVAVKIVEPRGCSPALAGDHDSSDRSSPPLCEIELTASDEDEGSVLELVIPTSRDSKKPSLKEKTKFIITSFFYICCCAPKCMNYVCPKK